MGIAFDYAADRPEHIEQILNGLDRYNPETTTVFQDYVVQQCENQTYDCYANLALLKLYQFNPHLNRDDTIISILAKALTVSPSPDFSLCLHLLPPAVLNPPRSITTPLASAVAKLNDLNNALSSASFAHFWELLHAPAGSNEDDAYADLVANVVGFEELMRVRIAATISQSVREVKRSVLEGWLDLRAGAFERFVGEVCGWEVTGEMVRVPLNKENEAKGTVVRENVRFDQFARVVRRAYEQPA